MPSEEKQLAEAKKQHRGWLLQQPGVEGVSIGEDEDNKQPCLQVLTNRISAETKRAIASRLKVPVVFKEAGEIKAG